jgi:(1->4)-alpha-D-glucan 1-alpha-D-glucosylmutase
VIEQTSQEASETPNTITAFISNVLLGAANAAESDPKLAFAQRLQQVSGPASAKGVEDTALYVYVPLVSRNEVGGAPDRPLDDAVDRFHAANVRRAKRWPVGLVTTNTHDAKRSGDIHGLRCWEVPHEWQRAVHRWRRLNAKHRRTVRGRIAPDTNTEYLFYQTLIGLWPAPRAARRSDDLPDRSWRDAACARLTEHMRKAAREAKTRTSWIEPDAEYERAIESFVAAVLEPGDDAPFLPDVARFVSRVAPLAASNALGRLVLHLTSPGTADIYQGDEFWNFSLVDPDNRRQVDYDARAVNSVSYRWPRPRCAKGCRLTCTRTISNSW